MNYLGGGGSPHCYYHCYYYCYYYYSYYYDYYYYYYCHYCYDIFITMTPPP